MSIKTLVKDCVFVSAAILTTAGLLDLFNLCPVSTFFSSWSTSFKFIVITFVGYMIGWLDAKLYEK